MLDLRGITRRADFDYELFKAQIEKYNKEPGMLVVHGETERGKLAMLSRMLELIPESREILVLGSRPLVAREVFTALNPYKKITFIPVPAVSMRDEIVHAVRRVRTTKNALVVMTETDTDNLASAAIMLATKEGMTIWCKHHAPDAPTLIYALKDSAMRTMTFSIDTAQDEIVDCIKLAVSITEKGDHMKVCHYERITENAFAITQIKSRHNDIVDM